MEREGEGQGEHKVRPYEIRMLGDICLAGDIRLAGDIAWQETSLGRRHRLVGDIAW